LRPFHHFCRVAAIARMSMIPKSGDRFSEKIMLKQNTAMLM